jgi:hypothetical protein
MQKIEKKSEYFDNPDLADEKYSLKQTFPVIFTVCRYVGMNTKMLLKSYLPIMYVQ